MLVSFLFLLSPVNSCCPDSCSVLMSLLDGPFVSLPRHFLSSFPPPSIFPFFRPSTQRFDRSVWRLLPRLVDQTLVPSSTPSATAPGFRPPSPFLSCLRRFNLLSPDDHDFTPVSLFFSAVPVSLSPCSQIGAAVMIAIWNTGLGERVSSSLENSVLCRVSSPPPALKASDSTAAYRKCCVCGQRVFFLLCLTDLSPLLVSILLVLLRG